MSAIPAIPAIPAPTAGPCRQAACAVLLALVAALLPAALAPAEAAAPGVQRWAGYRIDAGRTPAGTWIGAYTVGKARAYVITPRAGSIQRGGYRREVVADHRGRPGAFATARAAWVLSKYGAVRDQRVRHIQHAAVDAAVQHLLTGGPYRLRGTVGARRIRQAGSTGTVRSYASYMLRESARHAGRYRVLVSARGVDVGNELAARARVVDGRGRPVEGVRVRFALGGARASAATDGDGIATADLFARRAGMVPLRATVVRLPDHRLYLLQPRRKGAATLAVAGVKRTVTGTRRVAVRGTQEVAIAARPRILAAGEPAATLRLDVDGWGGARPVTATAYGPFATASAASCTGEAGPVVTTRVDRDGEYLTAPRRLPGVGFWAWQVEVGGNRLNQPADVCGAVTTAKATPLVDVDGVQRRIDRGDPTTAEVTARQWQTGVPLTAVVRLHGPFNAPANARCSAESVVHTRRVTVTPGAGVTTAAVRPARPGTYVWSAVLRSTDLTTPAESRCLATGTVLTVR